MSGLAFAITLRQKWNHQHEAPTVTVYDRDERQVQGKRQGYSLSLNGMDKDGGLAALNDMGLLDSIMDASVLGADGRYFKMWDQNWTELIGIKQKPYGDLPTANLRIARSELRKVLIEAAERLDINIKWGVQCTGAERQEDGRYQVQLSGGTDDTTTCDVLIAADGAHSKIRKCFRPDDTLQYAGAVQIGGQTRFPNGIPDPVNSAWGMILSGQGYACFVSPVDEDSIVWAMSCKEDTVRRRPSEITSTEAEALIKEALRWGEGWKEPFETIVKSTDPSTMFIIPAMDKQPFNHEDVPSGVIFIGDSNHAVSPFAGNGANTALKDGCDLAEQMCKGDSLETAIAVFDRLSVPRAVKTLQTSHSRIGLAHAQGIRYTLTKQAMRVGGALMWLFGVR